MARTQNRHPTSFDHVKIISPVALPDNQVPRIEIARFEDVDDLLQLFLHKKVEHHVRFDGIVYQATDVRLLRDVPLDVIVEVLLSVDGIPPYLPVGVTR